MVSDMRGEQSHPLHGVTSQHIQDYAQQKGGKRLTGPHRFLGGWADKDVQPHQAVLDRSTRYPETPLGGSQAYVKMVANRQKAAYHVSKDSYIDNPAHEPDKVKWARRIQGQNVA
jgi:hypothetical protein